MSPSELVQPVVVEPADPGDGRELELALGSARRGRRSARSCRSRRKIRRARCPGVADGADRREHVGGRRAPGCSRAEVYCEPASEWCTSATSAPGSRRPSAIRSASSTSVGAHVAGELPADDHPAEHVDHEAEVHDALPAAQVREIRDPQPVRRAGGEVPLDEIRAPGGRGSAWVVRHGFPRRFAPWIPLAAISRCTWQRGTVLAGAPQRLPHPPIPVGLVVLLVRRADHLEQPLVLERRERTARRWPLVVRGRRHVQGPADRLDPEALAVLIDIGAHFVRSGSSSLAKNTRRRLQDLVRAAQLVVPPRAACGSPRAPGVVSRSPRVPLSASAWRTRLRSASGWTPRSAATCAIGRPHSNTSRTPRSINSSGYFLGRGMNTEFLSRGPKSSFQGLRQTRPGSAVADRARTCKQASTCARWRQPPLSAPNPSQAARDRNAGRHPEARVVSSACSRRFEAVVEVIGADLLEGAAAAAVERARRAAAAARAGRTV